MLQQISGVYVCIRWCHILLYGHQHMRQEPDRRWPADFSVLPSGVHPMPQKQLSADLLPKRQMSFSQFIGQLPGGVVYPSVLEQLLCLLMAVPLLTGRSGISGQLQQSGVMVSAVCRALLGPCIVQCVSYIQILSYTVHCNKWLHTAAV